MLIAAVVLLASLAAAAIYVASHIEPMLRSHVVQMLSERFQAHVELDQLHINALDGLNVEGRGLKVQRVQDVTEPPLIEVSSFQFHISLWALRQKPLHIGTVHVRGLRLNLPPKGERGAMLQPAAPKKSNSILPGGGFLMDKIICDDTVLTLGTNKPGKQPLVFIISNLVLTHIAPNEPMQFDAQLVNPKPVGNISAKGNFGPWNRSAPGDTPVDGQYSFTHADLSTIKGIGGMLSSTGSFSGLLDAIVVDGETDTPDFRIESGDHTLPLHTKFHATVDGTNGDVTLDPVEARLQNSNFTVRGSVLRTPGVPGHDITLLVTMPDGRLEDMLTLAVKSNEPLLRSDLQMNAKVHLPPGPASVLEKMSLAGNFRLTNVTYSSESIQAKMKMFSLRAQGRPKEANAASAGTEPVTAAMAGAFQMKSKVIHLSNIDYEMPGVQLQLDGSYTIHDGGYQFHGIVRTQAKISQMTTGIKSVLLRAVDPIFSKPGIGAQIPVKISGVHSEMHFGLDLGGKDKYRTGNSNATNDLDSELNLW